MKNRTIFLKITDRIFGPILVSLAKVLCTPRNVNTSAQHCRSILFIRPGGIGDAVLLIPAIAEMHRKHPSAKIDILAEKRNSGVFDLYREIRHVFHYENVRDLCAVIRGKYDVVIDTEQWHRMSAVVARMTKAPILIGYGTNERSKLFTRAMAYSQDTYEAQSFLDLLESLIGPVAFHQEETFLSVLEQDAETAESLLGPLASRDIIVLFPGSSIPERQWGVERFHQTAGKLADNGYGIAVVGGKNDLKAGEEIVSGIPGGLNLCGKLTLSETAAVLQKTALLITGDSGIMHLGYGVGTRIVALFGPGRDKKWAPPGSQGTIINKRLSCSPCTTFGTTPKCDRDIACLQQISVIEVTTEALKILHERQDK